jgi:hypothetical protein
MKFSNGCPVLSFSHDQIIQMNPGIWQLMSFKGLPELIKCLPIQFPIRRSGMLIEHCTVDWEQLVIDGDGTSINASSGNCSNSFGRIHMPYTNNKTSFIFYGCRERDGNIKESYLFAEHNPETAIVSPEIETLMNFSKLFKTSGDPEREMKEMCQYLQHFVKLYRGKYREIRVPESTQVLVLLALFYFALNFLFYCTFQNLVSTLFEDEEV